MNAEVTGLDSRSTAAKPALAGIRVADLTQFESGTACTEMLAFLGAEVIKVEPPVRGESGRYASATEATPPGVDSAFFVVMNASKHSVTADLKQEKGRALLRQLIEHSDVFVENFAPGTIERLGFDYEAVRRINPRIIYAQIKGYPADGPFGSLPAFDITAQAAGGSTSITGYRDGPPVTGGVHVGDTGTGLHCVIGILAALVQRQTTGTGQRVEISMQEAIISQARASYVQQIITGKPTERASGNGPPNGGILAMFPCKGGGPNDYCYMTIRTGGTKTTGASGGAHQWDNLLKVMGRDDLIGDPRYTAPAERLKNMKEVHQIITDWTLQHDKHEVMRRLGVAGLLASAVLDTSELSNDPTLRKRGTFVTIDHPQRGAMTIPGWPVKLSDSSVPVTVSPALGGDNERIYGELFGLSADELAALRAEAVI